jgi:hypothetical protein
MSHLSDVDHTYFQHLKRAWKLSFILFIHGLFPEIWKTRASDEICQKNKYNSTRAHLLKSMYGIEEKNG